LEFLSNTPVLVKASGGQWFGREYAELSSQEGFRGQGGHDGAEMGECKKVKREMSCRGGRELDGDVRSLFWSYPAVVMREIKIAISAVI
jgi:hypothetical protein